MIIPNGTIELKQKTPGGIDADTGHPMASESTWGQPIPCQYIINNLNYLARTHGGQRYTKTSYNILVQQQDIASEQLRLRDREGRIKGDFSIISTEQLDTVCQTKIIV